jgi:hypothetical protein
MSKSHVSATHASRNPAVAAPPSDAISPVAGGWWRRRRGDVLAILVLAAMTLAVFWKGLAEAPSMLGGDAAYLYQDYYTMASREVRAGRMPLWNPYILMGVPFHASLQPAMFYPLRWPLFWMDYAPGMVFAICLHYFLGAAAAYMFVRVAMGVGPLAGLIGAMSITFGGFSLGHASHPNYFLSYPWFFGTLLCVWLAARRRQWRWAVPAGACLGLMMLVGSVHLLLVLGVILGTIALYHTIFAVIDWVRAAGAPRARGDGAAVPSAGWRDAARPLGVVAAALLLGAAIGAVQLWPAYGLYKASSRGQAGGTSRQEQNWHWNYITAGSASLTRMPLQMVMPSYYGDMRLGYWGEISHDEMAHYAGVASLLLAAIGVFSLGRRRHAWAIVAIGAVGLCLAAARTLPFYRVAYDLLPPFHSLRYPTRIAWGLDIAISCLAAVGAQRLFSRSPSDRPVAGGARAACLALGAIVLLALCGAFITLKQYASNPKLAEAAVAGNDQIQRDRWFASRVEAAQEAPRRIFQGDPAVWGGFAAAVAGVALAGGLVLARRPAPAWAGPALAGVLAADLFAMSFGMVMYNDQFLLMDAAHPPAWVKEVDAGQLSRVMLPERRQTPRENSMVNHGMLWGYRQANGLGGGIVDSPARSQFLQLAEPLPTRAGPYEFPGRFKDLAGVKYYLLRPDAPLIPAGLEPVLGPADGNSWRLCRNLACLPMAFFVDQVARVPAASVMGVLVQAPPGLDLSKTAIVSVPPPAETAGAGAARREANVSLAVPGLWEISCEAEKPGQLVVSEGFDPGWRAEIDGAAAQVYQTDDQIMSVAVPAGRHAVTLRYDPPEFRKGVWLTLAGLFVLLAAGAAGFVIAPRGIAKNSLRGRNVTVR